MRELLHSGEASLSGPALERLARISTTVLIVVTNVVGVVSVLLIGLYAVPLPSVAKGQHLRLVNTILAAGYVAFSLAAGVAFGTRRMHRLRRWLCDEQMASTEAAQIVLRAPLALLVVQLVLWFVAAILFGAINLQYSGRLGAEVALTVLVTGLVTASCAFLLTELVLRPAAARALAEGMPGRLTVPGVATRAVLAWAMGTGLARARRGRDRDPCPHRPPDCTHPPTWYRDGGTRRDRHHGGAACGHGRRASDGRPRELRAPGP